MGTGSISNIRRVAPPSRWRQRLITVKYANWLAVAAATAMLVGCAAFLPSEAVRRLFAHLAARRAGGSACEELSPALTQLAARRVARTTVPASAGSSSDAGRRRP